MDKIFTFDVENFHSHVLEGLKSGAMVIRNGNAFWAGNSGKTGIAQHLPLKQILLDTQNTNDILKVIKASQGLGLAAIGVSTGLILGAIVIQTVFLSRKIDKLQQKMDLIAQEIKAQNTLFYIEKLTKYFGVVETARVLLLDKSIVSETEVIASNIISQLAVERNEVLSLIDNLIGIADQQTEAHLGLMLDFINMVLDLMPKAIFIESQLCDQYEKYRLAEHLMRENSTRYTSTLQRFREWCNEKAKSAIQGKATINLNSFHEKKDELRLLFESQENRMLLEQLKIPALEVVTP